MELRDITSIEVNYSNKEKRKKKKKNFAKSYPKVKLEHIPIKCLFDPILIVR